MQKWVLEGAAWRRHWSQVPVARPTPPSTGDQFGMINDIDRFVRSRLPHQELRHGSEADRISLIRRVTFDLTGLVPTPAEVEGGVADGSLKAYENAIDRLIASPHYGEHMAHFWLDAALR